MRRSFSANSKCKNCELKDPLVRNNQSDRLFRDCDIEITLHGASWRGTSEEIHGGNA